MSKDLIKPIVSLLKELTAVQTTLKKSDASDAGKTDVVDKATAANDIGFSLMRNTINNAEKVTGSDITNYIERAEELNDEVDTVPYGLETDDGQIVKVYVNAEQADKFEEAMKNMLGMEDDIEEAINRLTTEFDIVDVVWPQSDEEENGEVEPDADLSIDDTDLEDDEDDFAEDEYDVIASVDNDKAPVAAEKEAKPELDALGNPKKKKKAKKKPEPAEPVVPVGENEDNNQEKTMTIGSKFLARVLAEADGEDRDGVRDNFNIPLDSAAKALVGKLKLPLADRLVAFYVMCGIPGRWINTAEAEETILSAANLLRESATTRRAFLAFYELLASTKGYTIPTKESLQEAKDERKFETYAAWKRAAKKMQPDVWFDGDEDIANAMVGEQPFKRGKTKSIGEWDGAEGWLKLNEATKPKRGSLIQKLLETILVKLGLPESLITTSGPPAVGTGIYTTAALIEQNSELERALRLLGTRLGIKSSDAQQGVEESISEAVDLGTQDDYANAVVGLASALGIPDIVLTARRGQLVQSLRERKATLRNRAQVLTAVQRLQDILTRNTVTGTQPEEAV